MQPRHLGRAELFQNTLQIWNLVVGRHINLHWHDSHITISQSPLVCLLAVGRIVIERTLEPEVAPALRILVRIELLAPDTTALAADAHALDIHKAFIGAIHSQTEATLGGILQH